MSYPLVLVLGGTRYDTDLQVAQYQGGNVALLALDAEDGSPVATLSVNIVDAPNEPLCFWVKDWSENKGVAAQLLDSGYAKPTGRTTSTGYVTGVPEYKLGPELAAAFLDQVVAGSDLT